MTISIARSARLWLAYAAAIAAILATLPLSTSSAVAADMLAQPRPAVVAAPLWTGFYIGLHGGGGWGSSRLEDPDFSITYQPVSIKSKGWLAGAQMGADWQFGSVVIGGELDTSWASVKGSTAPDPGVILSGLSVDYRALATGTGRAGYAIGNFLGYAKAGVAWANVDFKSALGSPFPIDVNHQRTGLTAGAGLEMALLGNLSARLEYDYIYFGPAAIALGTRRNPSNVDHQLQLLKLGLNWRVNGDYLLARY
jgi:outer membrane immunogenic protein